MPESEPKPKLIELVAPGAGQGWKAVLRNGKPAVVHEIPVPPAEAQAAAPRLQRLYEHRHPSLSPVLAWGTEQTGVWVAVEPNEGTPLGSVLTRGPLTPPAAAALGAAVLSAVAALHEAGIALGGFGATAVRITTNGEVRLAGHPAAAVRGAPSQSDLRADVRSCGMAVCAAFGVDPAGAPAPPDIAPGPVVTLRALASRGMGPAPAAWFRPGSDALPRPSSPSEWVPSPPARTTNPPAPAPPEPPRWVEPEPAKPAPTFESVAPPAAAAAPAFATSPPEAAPAEPPPAQQTWSPVEPPAWKPGEGIPVEPLGTGVATETRAPAAAPAPAPVVTATPVPAARQPVPRPPYRGGGPLSERPPWLVPAAVAVAIVLLLGIVGVVILNRGGSTPTAQVHTTPSAHASGTPKTSPSASPTATGHAPQTVPTYAPASADPVNKVQICTATSPCNIPGGSPENATTCDLGSCKVEVALYFSSVRKSVPYSYVLKFFDRCTGQTTNLPGPNSATTPATGYIVAIPSDHWSVSIPSGVKSGALVAVSQTPGTAASAPLLLGGDTC